jgi:hypothetical protein
MKILFTAYATLHRLGLVKNHAVFSDAYLNKGRRYFDHVICSRRPAAVSALVSLYVRVGAIGESLTSLPRYRAQGQELVELARAVWTEIEAHCCSVLPLRRRLAAR